MNNQFVYLKQAKRKGNLDEGDDDLLSDIEVEHEEGAFRFKTKVKKATHTNNVYKDLMAHPKFLLSFQPRNI